MMSLLLGQRSHPIDELQRLFEVGELVLALNVMILDHGPPGDHVVQLFHLGSFERRNASAARHAFFVGKMFGHDFTSKNLQLLNRNSSASLRGGRHWRGWGV